MNDPEPFNLKPRRLFPRWRRPEPRSGTSPASSTLVDAPPCPEAERLYRLAEAGGLADAAGQAIVVAALQVVRCLEARERALAAAAMSLAQREKMAALLAELDAFARALEAVLGESGRKMLAMTPPPPPQGPDDNLWWFALAEALQAIETGMQRIGALVAGRPRGSLARTLGSLTLRLLRRHEHALLAEAEHWMA
ncbi:MAG: hypothetical protein D6746_06770 [Bacteroidetes bacterium]|nr:MAG: hypothetical protein D6746_06770 [Bacteroidota bacterium]GIV58613.1 MAG: hypothetical protein KatS3mg042_1526 [Rhodothermaceae bacterium]